MNLLDLARAALAGRPAGCPAFEPNVARPAAADSGETSGHWLILHADGRRIEMYFSPAVTRAQLDARYPGAALIALPETASAEPRPATPEEAIELRRLVDAVAAQEGYSEEEKVEALEHALRDAPGTLRCLRALLQGV